MRPKVDNRHKEIGHQKKLSPAWQGVEIKRAEVSLCDEHGADGKDRVYRWTAEDGEKSLQTVPTRIFRCHPRRARNRKRPYVEEDAEPTSLQKGLSNADDDLMNTPAKKPGNNYMTQFMRKNC